MDGSMESRSHETEESPPVLETCHLRGQSKIVGDAGFQATALPTKQQLFSCAVAMFGGPLEPTPTLASYSTAREKARSGGTSPCFGLSVARHAIGQAARPTVSWTHARPGSCRARCAPNPAS